MRKITRAHAIIVALVLVNLIWTWQNIRTSSSNQDANFPLLAKRLQAQEHDDILINFSPLRNQVQDYLKNLNLKSSFYFEYLFSGTAIDYGDNQELVAASLMKVPLVMNLYKEAEMSELNLDQQATVTEAELSDEYGDLWKQGSGTVISLRDAAKLAMENSDNTAANVIFDAIKSRANPNNLDALHELDAPLSVTSDNRIQISARAYSSIFKCLYFACFLSKHDSQEILGFLTQSKLDNGLVSGLPAGVVAAHKIGTFSNSNEGDCGIVYVPKRTYIFCAMLQEQFGEADPHIKVLSKMVYDYVSSQK